MGRASVDGLDGGVGALALMALMQSELNVKFAKAFQPETPKEVELLILVMTEHDDPIFAVKSMFESDSTGFTEVAGAQSTWTRKLVMLDTRNLSVPLMAPEVLSFLAS